MYQYQKTKSQETYTSLYTNAIEMMGTSKIKSYYHQNHLQKAKLNKI
ncbi:hypothetical protein MNB_SV-13-334 [hydrothermal vent metagenome]|uniref:Uncharacterized protein n=1 Tax=hydrothermal vent metagenome TaxID=652676 RepID=A0A1W1CYD6_9ZZZZ